jgi:hypothetical protein
MAITQRGFRTTEGPARSAGLPETRVEAKGATLQKSLSAVRAVVSKSTSTE